jgi:iron uptake system EfeUOB component EfeO/EfeM
MTDKNRRARILSEMAATHQQAVAYSQAHPGHLLRYTETVAALDTSTEAELFASLEAEYQRIHAAGEVPDEVDPTSPLDAILQHLLTKFHKLDEVLAKYHDDFSFCEYVRDTVEYLALVEEIIQKEQMEKN